MDFFSDFILYGDMVRLITIIGLLVYMWKKRSYAGISRRTQILFAVVFTARYISKYKYLSHYKSSITALYILFTYPTIGTMFFMDEDLYNEQYDTLRCGILVIGAAVVAAFVHSEFTVGGITWAFSDYLEAVAIIPQLYLVEKAGKSETVVSFYMFGLTSYRTLYIVNWASEYYYYGSYDLISIVPGVIQTLIYFHYFIVLLCSKLSTKNQDKETTKMKYIIPVIGYNIVPSSDSPKKSMPVTKI